MRDKPAEELPSNPWPLLGAVTVLAVGVILVAAGHWRPGSVVMAGALGVAGTLRLFLPEGAAGLLVIRRRWIDVALLFSLAVAVAVVAMLVPGRP